MGYQLPNSLSQVYPLRNRPISFSGDRGPYVLSEGRRRRFNQRLTRSADRHANGVRAPARVRTEGPNQYFRSGLDIR